jgi:hypothetical protein
MKTAPGALRVPRRRGKNLVAQSVGLTRYASVAMDGHLPAFRGCCRRDAQSPSQAVEATEVSPHSRSAHDLPELAANLAGFREEVREEAACVGGRRRDGAEKARVLVSPRAPLEAGAQARGGQGEDMAMRRQILSMGRESVSAWGESLSMQREDVSVFSEDLSS